MRSIYSALLVALLLTTGNALAYDDPTIPFAQSKIYLGLRDWEAPLEYDDSDRLYLNDYKNELNPVTSVDGSITPINSSGVSLGLFSGSASASAQNLTGKLSIPAIPGDWPKDDVYYNYSNLQESKAIYNDYLYYSGEGQAQLTLHFDITGSINFSDISYSGTPIRMAVEMDILDPLTNMAGYVTIFDNIHSATWDGGVFYNYHDINYGFDYTVDIELGKENNTWLQLFIFSEFVEPGSPGTTIDFSSTATYYAKELRELIGPDELGSELPLIDPSTGALLLESASGTNYAAPIPGAVWLLGSGLIGIVGIRRKYNK